MSRRRGMNDPSLKPDPGRKGSYYRRIEDIQRALKVLGVPSLPPGPQFLAYYFGCEKLAHGIIGIHATRPASDEFGHKTRLRLADIKIAAQAMGLPIGVNDLNWLFADHGEQHLLQTQGSSARVLRNSLTHDFGPTNAQHLISAASTHLSRMLTFLGCTRHVLTFLHTNFAHVP